MYMKIFKKMVLVGLLLMASKSQAMNEGVIQAFSNLDDNSKALVITGIMVLSGACYLANKLCTEVGVAYRVGESDGSDSDLEDCFIEGAGFNAGLHAALRVVSEEKEGPTVKLRPAPGRVIDQDAPAIGRSYQEVCDQLAQGVLEGDLNKVKVGIALGCDVHQKLSNYRSLRHFAYDPVIDRLLQAAGVASEVDFWGKTPEDYDFEQRRDLAQDMITSRY